VTALPFQTFAFVPSGGLKGKLHENKCKVFTTFYPLEIFRCIGMKIHNWWYILNARTNNSILNIKILLLASLPVE